ncbi:hypothetical protein KRP22_009998 [Phytophthora ramorum]|nr:RxLR effector protein SFI6 [Phytophthora ramorum]
MQPSSPPSGGSLSSLAAPRLLPLFLGVFGGGFVSLGVALAGVRSVVAVRWLLRLPGDLLLNAFVGLTLPVTGLHAVATGSRVTRGAKTQQTRWLQIAGATLGGFALSTLLASVLGVLLAMALQSIVPNSASLAQVWGLPSGASVAFVCPGEAANGSVALQSDGTLKCSANATTFVLDDVARTFVVPSPTPSFWRATAKRLALVTRSRNMIPSRKLVDAVASALQPFLHADVRKFFLVLITPDADCVLSTGSLVKGLVMKLTLTPTHSCSTVVEKEEAGAPAADQASVSNVDVVHSSHVLAGEDKRFLRSHQTTDDEGKHPEHDEEERKFGEKLFAALKLQKMQNDPNYRFKVFGRWKKYSYSADDVEKHVPNSFFDKYAAYRRIHG